MAGGSLGPDKLVLPTHSSNPSGGQSGHVYFNTTEDVLYYHNGTNWGKVSAKQVTLSAVDGSISTGTPSTIGLTGLNFGTSTCTIKFNVSNSVYTVAKTPDSDTSITNISVPSGVYNNSAGTSVLISVENSDGSISGAVSITILAVPTGGTVYTSGGYNYHKFTSSGIFSLPTSKTVEVLLVAGGGGSGSNSYPEARGAGGGGAGGFPAIQSTTLQSGAISVTVGAGGAGSSSSSTGGNGGNSSVVGVSVTAIGGGAGGGTTSPGGQFEARSGGSGGGTHHAVVNGGSGTSGQGNAGVGSSSNSIPYGGGGGGGKGGVGQYGRPNGNGNGGSGSNIASTWASATSSGASGYFAGGGAGGPAQGSVAGSSGGAGGGGASGSAGSANTGGGGGGAVSSGRPGGSGIVIIRYPV